MKTITLWTLILFLFTACSIDSEKETSKSIYTQDEPVYKTESNGKTDANPANISNSYDYAGKIHNDISESYLSAENSTTSTAATIAKVEELANANLDYVQILPSTYVSPTVLTVDSILTNFQGNALTVISNSALSLSAKLSLNAFLNSLMSLRDQQKGYEEIYSFIVNYETTVNADNWFTTADKKIILTTASISRYAFYFATKHRRKPRDRDWEISWGNIVAGIKGAEESIAKAIVMAAVCGIESNE